MGVTAQQGQVHPMMAGIPGMAGHVRGLMPGQVCLYDCVQGNSVLMLRTRSSKSSPLRDYSFLCLTRHPPIFAYPLYLTSRSCAHLFHLTVFCSLGSAALQDAWEVQVLQIATNTGDVRFSSPIRSTTLRLT